MVEQQPPQRREPRRPRHLMDPNNPIRPVNDASLTHVQRWVLSVLTVFTIAHLAVGIVLAALMVPETETVAVVGLNVIAGLFGVCGVAAGQMIHRREPLNAWLLLGLLPAAVGLWLAFG